MPPPNERAVRTSTISDDFKGADVESPADIQEEIAMKAAVIHDFNADLKVEDVARPAPAPGEVLVRIEASGLSGQDRMLFGGCRDPDGWIARRARSRYRCCIGDECNAARRHLGPADPGRISGPAT